jgi:hypothetical protein
LRKELSEQQELKERMSEELNKRLEDVRRFQAAKKRQVGGISPFSPRNVYFGDLGTKFDSSICCATSENG